MTLTVIVLNDIEEFEEGKGARLHFVKEGGAALFPHQIEGLFALFKLFEEQLKTIPFPLDQLDTFRLEAKCEDFFHELHTSLLKLDNVKKALVNLEWAIGEIEQEHPSLLSAKLQSLSLIHLIEEMKRSPNLQAFLWLGFFLSYDAPDHPLLIEIKKWRESLPEQAAYRTIYTFSKDEETIKLKRSKLEKIPFKNWLEGEVRLQPHLSLAKLNIF